MLLRLAKWISWIGHPIVLVSISVALVVATRMNPRDSVSILGALLLSVIVPTAILLFAGVRSGGWHDADISVREERRRFYPWAIPLSALGALATWWIRAPFFVLRSGFVTLALFVIAGLINLRLKISLHNIFAWFCAVMLFRVGIICGAAGLLLAGGVFWSRLFLIRHTLAEALAGAALGISGGIVAAWWP